MDKEQIKSEYEQLCKQAEQHNFNYYVLDDPTIEDDEYDRLMRRIKEIEAENPEIVSESSPTQHVGGHQHIREGNSRGADGKPAGRILKRRAV